MNTQKYGQAQEEEGATGHAHTECHLLHVQFAWGDNHFLLHAPAAMADVFIVLYRLEAALALTDNLPGKRLRSILLQAAAAAVRGQRLPFFTGGEVLDGTVHAS